MPELFIYLIKVNIVLVLFYLAYRFLLRPLTFYTLNRIFLIFGIVFSTAYPFVDLSALFEKNKEFISPQLVNAIPDWQSGVVPAVVAPNNTWIAAETFNYWIILQAIFWIGVLIMSLRLIIQLVSLYRLHKRSIAKTAGEHIYRDVSESVNPFSFLKNIYLNSSQLSQKELGSVLEHEQVHIKEWHTLDVLLSELNIIFYWFNPGAWLMKKAVKENLEFIADCRILQQGADSIAYQYDLLNVGLLKQSSPLVNHFSLLTIKRRIIMMNKQRSSRAQVSRYLLTLPLVILLAFAFTVTKAQFEKRDNHVTSSSRLNPQSEKPASSNLPAVSGKTASVTIPAAIKSSIEQSADVKESQDSAKYLINGKPVSHIVDGKPVNDITAVPANLRAHSYRLKGEAAARIFGPAYSGGVVFIITNANKDSKEVSEILKKINPPLDAEYEMQYDQTGQAHMSYPRTSTLVTMIVPIYDLGLGPFTRANGSGFGMINNSGHALYFINGKETTEAQANKLSPEQIERIYVTHTNPEANVEMTKSNLSSIKTLDMLKATILMVREGSIPYNLTDLEKTRGAVIIIKKIEQKK